MPNDVAAQVGTVIVNYQTPELVEAVYTSFRRFYPTVEVVMVDNGSHDVSTEYVKSLIVAPHVRCVLNPTNTGHGPALHQGLWMIQQPYALTLDTDCTLLKTGLLEAMVEKFEAGDVYAVGWLRHVNDNGVPYDWHVNKPSIDGFHPYIHPSCALYDVAKYKKVRGFFDHGAPALQNMIDAAEKKWGLVSFPVEKYAEHLQAGTRRMFDGHWHPADGIVPKPWDAQQSFPI